MTLAIFSDKFCNIYQNKLFLQNASGQLHIYFPTNINLCRVTIMALDDVGNLIQIYSKDARLMSAVIF